MRDPISDVIHFLTFRPLYANGPVATLWGPFPIVLFWLVAIGAIWIAARNWKAHPEQRNARTLYFAFARFLLGVMWLQQTFWKLPPTFTDRPDGSGGLRQWMEFMTRGAAFGFHRALVRDVILPNFQFFAYQVWAAETAIAVMLMLGLFARLGSLLGLLQSLNLWLGLYNAPNEWAWTYAFLVLLMGFLIAVRAGRALGADALIGPPLAKRLAQQNPRLVRLVEWAS
jgi:uncharacterized membrane protein YphA (DoxX/SURF4 family)